MGRLSKTSTGRVALSLLVVIAIGAAFGFGITAAFAQEGGTISLRPCEGAECDDGLDWCPITIGSTQGPCPTGLETGLTCCIWPCVSPENSAICIGGTNFSILGTNCSFTATAAPQCNTCEANIPNTCRFVVVKAAQIPTVSEWGLIVMGLLIVSAAVILIRRANVAPRPA
jgi:hypothetical protein